MDNDSGLRAMLEELDAEMGRQSPEGFRATLHRLMASGDGMHRLAEKATRCGLMDQLVASARS